MEIRTSFPTGRRFLAYHESLYVWVCRRWPINIIYGDDLIDKAGLEQFHESADALYSLRQTLQHVPIVLFRQERIVCTSAQLNSLLVTN